MRNASKLIEAEATVAFTILFPPVSGIGPESGLAISRHEAAHHTLKTAWRF
jgi:hypothetical protein